LKENILENVKHFRLINGEEVLAEIFEENKTNIIVKNPMQVIDNSGSIVLTKFIPFSKDQLLNFDRFHVITISDLHDEMVRYYNNSILISMNATEKSIEGISKVNDMMEDYIHNSSDPSDDFFAMIQPSSNTIH